MLFPVVLGGMQFWAVVRVLFWVAVGSAADHVGVFFLLSQKTGNHKLTSGIVLLDRRPGAGGHAL